MLEHQKLNDWLDGQQWSLFQWAKGLDVFTPYIDGPSGWARGVQGFSADWVEIATGSYDYIKGLRKLLEANNVRG
jgi:hypothetical protein